jgi:hypothetical protein
MNFKINTSFLKNSAIIGRMFVVLNLSQHKKTSFSVLKSSLNPIIAEEKSRKSCSIKSKFDLYLATINKTITKQQKQTP